MGLYDLYDYFYDGLSGERNLDYYNQEESLKTTIIEESVKLGKCEASCVLNYVRGDIKQRLGHYAAKNLVKTAAKKAIVSGANKLITYYSVYGFIKCTVRCCDE